MTTEYETFCKALLEQIEAQVEYATTHQDAGDAYEHLPREGCFDYDDGGDRLRSFLEENEIVLPASITFEQVVDFVLDSCTWHAGAMFSPFGRSGAFEVCSAPVGEVECAFDLSALEDEFGPFARGFWLKAKKESVACLRGNMQGLYPQGYAYESTDAIWFALVTADEIREFIENETTEA